MSVTVLTIAAAKAANIDVIENGRGTQAVHDVVVAMRANRRSGSANTKTKAEVAYSGKKPWRQKGTGRARAGYASSVIWAGGGVVFAPKTKEFVTFLKSQTEADKVLVISTHFDEVTYKAARNVQPILLNTASEVNTEQLLAFQKIIVTNEALAKLAERLA